MDIYCGKIDIKQKWTFNLILSSCTHIVGHHNCQQIFIVRVEGNIEDDCLNQYHNCVHHWPDFRKIVAKFLSDSTAS